MLLAALMEGSCRYAFSTAERNACRVIRAAPPSHRIQVGLPMPRIFLASCLDFFAFRFSFRVKTGFFLASLWLFRSFVMAVFPDG
jgi:hypothetical protein